MNEGLEELVFAGCEVLLQGDGVVRRELRDTADSLRVLVSFLEFLQPSVANLIVADRKSGLGVAVRVPIWNLVL